MRALVSHGPGNWLIEDVPEPILEFPDDVLLKPLYSGICFTDNHAYVGAPGVVDPPVEFGTSGVMGHEWGGEVAEVGPEATNVKVGDRVAVNISDGCGKCLECRAGIIYCSGSPRRRGFGSPGGFSELCVVSESSCYKVPDAVSDVQAGYIEPLAMGTRAARLSGVTAGDNIVFLGVHDYGMSAFQWLRHIAGQVLVVDSSPARQQMVRSLGGATDIIDPTVTDPVARAREMMPWGADVVFVANEEYMPKSFHYLSNAIHIARQRGTVVTVGHEGREELAAPIGNWIGTSAYTKELKILGFGHSFANDPIEGGRARGDYQRAIDGCATGAICGPDWIPTVVPFADLNSKSDVDEVFALYPDKAPKILLKIWGT